MKPRYLKDIAYEVWRGYASAAKDPFLVMASIDDHPSGFGPAFLEGEWPQIRDSLNLKEQNRSEGRVEHQDLFGPDTVSTVTYVTCSTTWKDLMDAINTDAVPKNLIRHMQILGPDYVTYRDMKAFLQKGGELRHFYNPGLNAFLKRNKT